jgi:peroxiredoxin
MREWRKYFFGTLIAAGSIALVGVLILALRGTAAAPPASTPPALSLAAAMSDTPALATGASVAAVVDGQPISRQEWQQLATLDRVMSELAGQPPPGAEVTLDRLINQRLVLKSAGSDAIVASDSDAQDRLAALKQSWGVDDAALDRALVSANLSRQDVVEEVKRLIVVEAYLERISSTQDTTVWLADQRAQAQIGIYADLAALAPIPATPVAPAVQVATPVTAPALSTGVNLGQQAPDFTLDDLGDAPVRLSDLRGKPVVINFWATWCPPCRQEAPALQAAYERYRDQGVVLLGVDSREDAETVRTFASQNGLMYPLLLDREGDVSAEYQVLGIPTTVFLDAAGVVQTRHVGPLTEDQFTQYTDPLINSAPTTSTPVTQTASDFSLPRENGETVTLSDYRGKSSVVLVFYRGET